MSFLSAFEHWSDLGALISLGGFITTSPTQLTVPSTATVGTTVGTASVVGGSGTYTFTLTGTAGGKYSITSGGTIQVAGALTAGTDTITIHADNGAGSVIDLTTTVIVTSSLTGIPMGLLLALTYI